VNVPTPWRAGTALAVAALASLAAVGPARAVKLWERHGPKEAAPSESVTAAPASTPSASEVTDQAKEPKDATGPAAASGAAPALAAPADRSTTDSRLLDDVAAALPPDPGHDLADPASFVRRVDHLTALVPLARAAFAPEASERQWLAYASALATRGFLADAAQGYLTILRADPTLVTAWIDLGSLMRVEGNRALSQRVLDHALELEPSSGLAWYQLGLTRRAAADLPGADAAFLQALEWDPSLWLPLVNPHVIVNDRALIVLHDYYVKRSRDWGPLAGSPAMP
jgi:tetratricopeptide (TPR) repeat protein